MNFVYFVLVLSATINILHGSEETSTGKTTSFPVYKPDLSSERYSLFSWYPWYNMLSLHPVTAIENYQGALRLVGNFIYRLSVALMGAAGLAAIGGVIFYLICRLSAICSISLERSADVGNIMGSFMTPEKLANTARLVQEALGKYQRLQKSK